MYSEINFHIFFIMNFQEEVSGLKYSVIDFQYKLVNTFKADSKFYAVKWMGK